MHAEEFPRESGESGAMDRREIDIDIDIDMRWEEPGGLENERRPAARPCPRSAIGHRPVQNVQTVKLRRISRTSSSSRGEDDSTLLTCQQLVA